MTSENFRKNEQFIPQDRRKIKKSVEVINLDVLDKLCDEVNLAVEEQPVQLISKDFSEWLYSQYTAGFQRYELSRMHPDNLQFIIPIYQNEFLGRLKTIYATDLEGLEVFPVLEESEFKNVEEEIGAQLKRIDEEKIKPIEAEVAAFAQNNNPDSYWQYTASLQKLTALKAMFDGLLACSDRRLFDNFANPEIGAYFFKLKGRISAASRQAGEQKRKLSAQVLPIQECEAVLQSSSLDPEGINQENVGVRKKIDRLVVEHFPGNQNQYYIAEQLLKDTFGVMKENTELSKVGQWKILLLQLPRKFAEWRDYKALTQRNENYTSAGVANIALADEFVRLGQGSEPFVHAEEFLKNTTPPGSEKAREYFLKEIKLIYESRRSIQVLLDSIEGRTELLTPAEAMRDVSDLTGAMHSGELERVIEIVARLESKNIDIYHETSNYDSYHKILDEGKMYSTWAARRYSDTFFGGGIYFWGAQQEDWLKGGSEALHVIYPVKDLFIVRNKYNNPNKGPFSGAGRYFGSDESSFPHSQKKYNIIAMMPARALNIEKWEESPHRPLSNEGYTAETIADIEEKSVEECNFIWRIDKHHGQYDTEFFITPEKETLLKKYLGDDIRVEHDVTTNGFGGGEYDRLIIPRSISILRATSIAYALRVPEVVYDDRLEALHEEEKESEQEMLQAYREAAETGLKERSPELIAFIDQLVDREELSEKDKILIRYFLSKWDEEGIQTLQSQLTEVYAEIGTELPNRSYIEALVPKREWFNHESKIHGTPHIMRVLMNVEMLGRLAHEEIPKDIDINLRALEIASSMHDVKRLNDRASDIWHGKRAAEFLWQDKTIHPEIDEDCRLCACGIMHNHAIDDHDHMTPEEIIFKDADALDRYRFSSGPDWRFMRLTSSKKIATISYSLAAISNFLLSNGYKRAEAVLQTAEALGLFQKTETR